MVTAIAQTLRKILTPDTIGPAECPILYRWTLFPLGYGSSSSSSEHLATVPDWMPKLLLHHFVPQADERHFHDHPRGFWTLVLKGGYDDMVPCTWCAGTGNMYHNHSGSFLQTDGHCLGCSSTGQKLGTVMRRGMLRYRPPEHEHRTRVHAGGAWTLVLMGPKRREWGFLVGGKLMEWKQYFAEYGFGMRCV